MAREAALDFWNPTASPPPSRVDTDGSDFWLPAALQEAERKLCETWFGADLTTSLEDGASLVHVAVGDYWSPVEADEAKEPKGEDWGHGTILPWFDPEAHDNPFVVAPERPSSEKLATKRGRWLAQLADIPEPRRRAQFAEFFAEIFERFPSANTFRALSELAIDDIDPEAIRNGCAFRIEFLETPKLAYHRRFSNGVPLAYPDPAALLSWRRAVRLAVHCDGENPSTIVDDDWFLDWIALDPDHPSHRSYLDYIEWRIYARYDGDWEHNQGRALTRPVDGSFAHEIRWLTSRSRIGLLAMGQRDIVGVAYPDPRSPRIVSSRRGTRRPGT